MTGFKILDIFLKEYCTTPGKILDVGGSGSIIIKAVEEMGHKYESLNLNGGTYVVPEDPYHWTMIKDNTYDYVISITAFEHIEFPWLTFLEMVRVTKKNGIIYIIAPSLGMMHPNSLDCWRYFPDGIRALGKWGKVSAIKVTMETETIWQYCEGVFRKDNNG